jgi:TIR domain
MDWNRPLSEGVHFNFAAIKPTKKYNAETARINITGSRRYAVNQYLWSCTMKVFISWSGGLSHDLGKVLSDWLPSVIQRIQPFFTPSDIEKGVRWHQDVSEELEAASFGVFCLTSENLTKPWIMFEAGALSKHSAQARVCPLLFDVDNAELEGPLKHFQATSFSEQGVRELIGTMNASLKSDRLREDILDRAFDKWWPQLDTSIRKIKERHAEAEKAPAATRTERDLLEDILELSRIAVDTRTDTTVGVHVGNALRVALMRVADLLRDTNDNADRAKIRMFAADMLGPILNIASHIKFDPIINTVYREQLYRVENALRGGV